MSLTRLDARSLQVRLAEGRADLYDIREPAEYAREHIDGARLLPAGRLGRELPDRTPGRLAVFMCQSGMRTTENATRILGCISGEVAMLDGGLPEPVLQYEIVDRDGRLWRLDFAWPEHRVAVEFDGFEYRSSSRDLRRDRQKRAALIELGWQPMGIVTDDVRNRPAAMVRQIRGLFGQPVAA